MRRLTRNRVLVIASVVAMAALSTVILIFGGDESRFLGLAGLIMFGGGGLTYIAGEFLSPPVGRPHVGAIGLPSGSVEGALVIAMREGRVRWSIVAQALFAVGGVILAIDPFAGDSRSGTTRLVLVGMAVLLAINVINTIRGGRDRRSFVALAPSGISIQAFGGGAFVPWDAIVAITEVEMAGHPFLGIDVNSAGSVVRTGGARILGGLEGSLIGHDLGLGLTALALSPDEMTRIVRHYLAHPADRATLETTVEEALALTDIPRRG